MFPAALQKELSSVCAFFQGAISTNKLSHAYLLCGSNTELKDFLALELTKILNCTSKTDEGAACGQCANCQWLINKQHPELPYILEPDLEKSKKGVILVKQVQALLSRLQHKSAYYRVILIKKAEVEFLPAESANSLLKTIEEPNPRTLFLLYAKDSQAVLPTIASRCQAINIPAKSPELGLQTPNETAAALWQGKLNWLQATQLAANIVENTELKIVEGLDGLLSICLHNYEISQSELWLQRIESIENAKARLKAFCSPKPTLEELFWSISG